KGVDVVFAAAGGTGTGIYQAAKDGGKLAIGVDSNQNHLQPGTMLTSMVKRVDVAVYNLAKKTTPGVTVLGLKEGGVDYALALAASAAHRRSIQQWWADGWDLLVTPTTAEPPTALGEFANSPEQPMAPLVRSAQFVAFTPAFNTSGQPAISLPLHWTPDGLPVGVQFVDAYGREDVLSRIAAQLEQAIP
ncbi:MAG: amidase family protein, partial [Ilumatobacteraceae bacterium]